MEPQLVRSWGMTSEPRTRKELFVDGKPIALGGRAFAGGWLAPRAVGGVSHRDLASGFLLVGTEG
jgi:hypothetical protein